MQELFLPPSIQLTDDSKFSIFWTGNEYNVIDGCVDISKPYDYKTINSWGFVTNVGVTSIGSDFPLAIGVGCSETPYTVDVMNISRSLFNAPNFSPYEPFYFALVVIFGIWLFKFCLNLLFGKGWK